MQASNEIRIVAVGHAEPRNMPDAVHRALQMILHDACFVPQPLRQVPEARVFEWTDGRPLEALVPPAVVDPWPA